MSGKRGSRPVVTLACTECKERNYTTEKNRRNDPGRIEFNKYCPRCRQHRLHRETRQLDWLKANLYVGEQLNQAEQLSPKQQVVGSIPASPAFYKGNAA